MSEVKALFPIGKTQWRKWNDMQRNAFNEARQAGVPFADAVEQADRSKESKKGLFDILEDVVETVAEVVEVATPVLAVAKTVKRATRVKRNK